MKKFLTIFIFVISQAWASQQTTLFVLQDAGETHALLPVIESWDEDCVILAGGTAAEIVAKKPALRDKTITYAQIGIEEKVDKNWRRDQQLSQESLDKITHAIQASTVVTGVAFELHGQLLQSYPRSYAFWDNINLDGTDPYFQTAKKVALLSQRLMVPSETFLSTYPEAHVVGQPALEKWKDDLSLIDASAVRARLPFEIISPLIVFIGGYGAEYNEALSLFLDTAPATTILLTYHPKMEGKVEKEELARRSLPNVYLIDQISTIEAVAIADHVICHQSTVGIQAALAGKHVLYFIPPTQSYTNLLIEEGAVAKVSTLDSLEDETENSRDLFSVLKIPRNSINLIYHYLHE